MHVFLKPEIAITKIHFAATVASTGQVKRFGPRKYHGLVYKISGQATYSISGEDFIHAAHTIIYLPKGREYSVLTDDDSACIAINFDLLEDVELESGALIEPDNPEIYFELFQEMEKEWRSRRVGYHVKCMSILYNIIALLVTAASMQNAPQYKYKCLKKAVVYLEDHYTDNTLNIGALAAKCSMSEAYFRRCFKEAYRMSPNQYIKTLRMNRAKDLLKTGLLSISEVAEQVGFADIYYFSKAFKRAVGMNPTAYKNQSGEI